MNRDHMTDMDVAASQVLQESIIWVLSQRTNRHVHNYCISALGVVTHSMLKLSLLCTIESR